MEAFLAALSELGEPTYWLALFAAIAIGTAVGFIPGVGATLVTALMVPFVVLTIEDPAIGIVMLAMVGALNNTLNSIPAVLVGLPSEETQVTYFEGHQLARRGRAAHTLGAIYAVSAVGGLIGAVALALVIPVIKPFILEFSYAEIAMLAFFGVAMVALLSRGGMVKGLAAGLFGILLGTVGLDPLTGTARFTLGAIQLWNGLPVVATILGIFALPELIDLSLTRRPVATAGARVSVKEVFDGALYGLKRWPMTIRQSLFGTFMGAIPGVGGTMIDWLSYAFGTSLTRGKERANFGKGSLDGVLFAESANNSKAGGQALPTLTLGVPGSTSWAIIVVALLAYGITPGPSMVTQHADITMLMVITLAVGNVIVAGMGLLATNWLARITRVPYTPIGFAIMPLVLLAAYVDLDSWLAIPLVLGLGVVGLLMKRYRWPRPPLILGFILGPIAEANLQSALSIYGPLGLATRPIAIVLFVVTIVAVFTLSRLSTRADATAPSSDATAPAGTSVGDRRPEDRVVVSVKDRLLQEANLGPVLAIAGVVPFAVATLAYPARAAALPLLAAVGIIALALVQLGKQLAAGEPRDEQVLDLGMRSAGMAGIRKASLIMVGTFALFLLLAVTVGLKYGAIALAAVGPIVLPSGRYRWLSGAISALVVTIFVLFLMERFVGVIWPTPILVEWFRGAVN